MSIYILLHLTYHILFKICKLQDDNQQKKETQGIEQRWKQLFLKAVVEMEYPTVVQISFVVKGPAADATHALQP
jgi:hypothetical protein